MYKNFLKRLGIAIITLIIFIGGFVIFFNRAPDRIIPIEGIVSPASGKIIGITQVNNPDIIFEKQGTVNHVSLPEITGPASVILIEMNPLDVHVQRAPIVGTITRMDHFDGKHDNALGNQKLNLVAENEKVVTVFEKDPHDDSFLDRIGVIQVAGRAARRIRNSSQVSDYLNRGEVYGRIILGSQVVVVIPDDHEMIARVGDRVIDGESVLAR